MAHEECLKQEDWGKQKEINKTFFAFISDGKGWRASIVGIVFALVVQVVTFAVLWGELKTEVKYQARDLEKVCGFLEKSGFKPPVP